ncbi:acetyl-CoA acetyltransferase [Bordetella trematum]|uniref:Acetyl-CoA acetyltransferase n=1 Tax=Bordetella trematum TaxID=123899 RepID=A0A157SH29_9BORD|nr:acetyl-CoA acetyltransferase [Bordetella trematum]AUL46168.1 acetyl-CoA acetyltransferase [Bordetella trematum]AZR92929.1 acetyl-CoA acetyltransferase [Bordetella trematum]NNH19744.1 acetyl-CoA acetyltransferase [Bordetella trematum]CZZ98512.1 acetyl-CoA acetyltransferase [Bordetella trematum]SAI33180.1 acetyl-CoA acetyltransferase [Bordetella trematum]
MHTQPVSLVGSGHTKFGRLDALSLEDLIVSAAREALDDAGLPASDVDAVFLGHFNSGMVSDGFASSLIHQASPELRFTPATRCENACASGAAALAAGVAAIQSGQAEVVLVVGAEKMTHNSTADVTRALAGAGYQNDAAEAALSFPQVFGLAAQEYTRRYQDPLPAMAAIAAKNHANALRNPLAQMQRALDVEACNTVSERNPLIAPPLRLTDCSLVSDGAAAVILTSAARAREFQREVVLRSLAHVSDFLPMSKRDFLAFEGPRLAIARALEHAGIGLQDLDFAEVHDCFTIAELLIYEAMGLAPAGQGHRALEAGTVMRGGALPVNLSGGLKAKGHPVGATGVSMHALSFRQLTGRAGDMQIEQAPTFGLVFNMGGAAVANYASVLEAKRA